jgi:hypothetical protein
MSERPTPSAGGDNDPTPPRGVPVTDDSDWYDEGWDEPNYLFRRAFVVLLVVVAVAGIAISVSQFIGDDDSDTPSASAAAEWDTIVVLTADEIRLLDRKSTDEIETYTASDDLLDAQSLVAGPVLVTMTDEGRITQIDLADGSQRRSRSGLDETLRITPGHPSVALSGPDTGGDVTVIDTRDRSTISVADIARLDDPLIFAEQVLVNSAGTHVAVPVPTAFQSVVIDLEAEISVALAGRVIAIDNERVVTEQPAGAESELEFYDLAGERLGSVDVPAPRATLLRPDGKLLLIADDGAVSTADADGSVSDVGILVDPNDVPIEITEGMQVPDSERLLAIGGRRVFVLDADGNQLGVGEGSVSTVANSGARCVIVGGVGSSGGASVLDLETGAVITEVERGVAGSTSYDGCTAAFVGAAPQLLSEGEVVEIDVDAISVIAPDGGAYVALDGRDAEYVRIGDDSPVEIGDRLVVTHFGQR